MRQLTFVRPGVIEWHDVPAPSLQADRDVVVEPLAVTRCDLDLYIAQGLFPVEGSFALGHETVGRVVDAGPSVTHVAPGDSVIFPFQVSCGDCPDCRRGHTNSCTSVAFRSSFGLAGIHGYEWGGGLSDRLRVPFADHMVLRLPDGADPAAMAGAADNVTDGHRAVAGPLRRHPGADVLVVGGLAQSIGMYAALAARALGAGRVVYLDSDALRLELVAATGIEVWDRTLAADTGPDVEFPITVEASATQEGLTFAIRSTAPSGLCSCIAGGVQEMASIPRMDMFGRGITLDISRAQLHRDLADVVRHVHDGDLDPLSIAGPALSFDDAATAMFDPSPKLAFVR